MDPLEIFYCYARKDRDFCEELTKHLAGLLRAGLITVWYDGDISPGTLWEQQIKVHLNTARIILLLVSPDFLSSDYCYGKEMAHALQRHYTKEALVIPVFLRPVLWTGTPFSVLQGLPSNARPITSWANRDEAFADVAKGIHQVVNDLPSQHSLVPDPPAFAVSAEQLPQQVSSQSQQNKSQMMSPSPLAQTSPTPNTLPRQFTLQELEQIFSNRPSIFSILTRVSAVLFLGPWLIGVFIIGFNPSAIIVNTTVTIIFISCIIAVICFACSNSIEDHWIRSKTNNMFKDRQKLKKNS